MAKMTGNRAMPTDEPVVLRPGIMHRETDFHGSGKHYALPPEHPERMDKGDLGLSIIPNFESRALTGNDLPFTNLRKR